MRYRHRIDCVLSSTVVVVDRPEVSTRFWPTFFDQVAIHLVWPEGGVAGPDAQFGVDLGSFRLGRGRHRRRHLRRPRHHWGRNHHRFGTSRADTRKSSALRHRCRRWTSRYHYKKIDSRIWRDLLLLSPFDDLLGQTAIRIRVVFPSVSDLLRTHEIRSNQQSAIFNGGVFTSTGPLCQVGLSATH